MIGAVIKEIIILILLCIAIILALGVIFYEYIPNSKIVPSQIAYSTPDQIVEELEQAITEKESEKIIKTYQINEGDLTTYQSTGNYNKGKVNPFADYVSPVQNTTENTTTNTITNTSVQNTTITNNTVSKNTTDDNSVGKFFDTGNK